MGESLVKEFQDEEDTLNRELFNRVTVGLIGIPIIAVVIYTGGWLLGALMALTSGLGAYEYFQFREKGTKGLSVWGVMLSAALPLIAVLYPTYHEFVQLAFALVIFGTMVSLIMVMWCRWPEGSPIESAAVTMMGVLYIGGTLSFWIFLRAFPEEVMSSDSALPGTILLIFPIWVTWIGDCFAYVLGSRWGKKKLAATVSPNKTVVGAVGGVAGSILGGLTYNHYLLSEMTGFAFSKETVFLVCVLIAVAGQLGDLSESVMKRQVEIKDSSNLIPGHGGVLDRMDGLFFTVPMTYFILLHLSYG
ncbi:MAG: phosphatidate cytidylyltransferase [Longimicrobiales bacterium]|nr:phosphatidate cytidylyltransferase [Longimicrobiales bacterium]